MTSYQELQKGQAFRGTGRSYSHHGELLQGVFTDAVGHPTPALVTLPCPLFSSKADATLLPESDVLAWSPFRNQDHSKSKRAAENTLAHLGMHRWGAVVRLISEVPRARGFGSSTADVLATIRAVANAADVQLAAPEIALLAVDSEQASDSIMYPEPVLFAQRTGRLLEALPGRIPAMTVLGFDAFPGHPGVGTVESGLVRYNRSEYDIFHRLLGELRDAVRSGDLPSLGRVATESTRVNQRYRPLPLLAPVLRDYTSWQARGVQIAHSGTVVGILFDRAKGGTDRVAVAREKLGEMGIANTWVFDVD